MRSTSEPYEVLGVEAWLSLSAETVAALQAFRKRHADAQRIHAQLESQPTTVDLSHYRSVLKNKAIVDEAEKILKEYQPVTYDVSSHVKAIETFEAKAVRCGSNSLHGIHKTDFVLFLCMTAREG